MCTVTIITLPGGGLRMVSNRDESRTRVAAVPPEMHVIDGVRVLLPRDPKAGGTWIAGNDRGVAMTLLNLNERPASEMTPGTVSRGRVIAHAAAAANARDAMTAVSELGVEAMSPFRLVVAFGDDVLVARWDGARFMLEEHSLAAGINGAPGTACFTSSGLGDAQVRSRVDLWRQWSVERDMTGLMQDDFHMHQWGDRPEISVRMARRDARTVSTTAVRIVPDDGVEMHYWADEVRTASRLALRPTAAVSVPMAEATV